MEIFTVEYHDETKKSEKRTFVQNTLELKQVKHTIKEKISSNLGRHCPISET